MAEHPQHPAGASPGGTARRPLPIGAFGLPFGYLLLPDTAEAQPVREGLLAGRLPADWPASLRGHELAASGDLSSALAAFTGDDVVSRFNRFVIDTGSEDPAQLREGLGFPLAALVGLVLYATGRAASPPDPDGLDGELAALALAAQASAAAEQDEFGAAAGLLARAVSLARPAYPALAGVLSGAAADIHLRAGELDQAVGALQAGIALLEQTDLATARGELHLQLGACYQQQAADRREELLKAIHHYHCALQSVTPQQAPEVFAAAHANLAAAYLTMPMAQASDQLRLGVAVGSLRAALTVYDPQTHPAQWASAQLNLANALVYAPSSHQADNLVEAVELYEAVLAARDRDADPLGYARVLANQGNALAHLGMFEHARGKLVEARSIFEEFGEYDATTSVRSVLDEIARQLALARTAP
jgi:tetratricopeptide (TPR) repeat protein